MPMALNTRLRTHTCGELRKENAEKEAMLSGWVHTRRDHGGVIFIWLRDRFGMTQVTINQDNKDLFDIASDLKKRDRQAYEDSRIYRSERACICKSNRERT